MTNIVSVKSIGKHKTHDLEVMHPDHQYYLSNGILTSNSHSTLYSMISYHTAYLKAHFPLEFLVSNMLSEVSSNSKKSKGMLIKIKHEIRKLGVKIISPDINTSTISYKIVDDKTLMTGLDALKYMGTDALPEIMSKRPFNSFQDFLGRVDGKKVRSTTIQALAASGCLDSFGFSRKLMFLHASDFKKKLQVWMKKDPTKRGEFNYPWTEEPEWTSKEKYALEQYYLGEGISGTLNERFDGFFLDRCIDFRLLAKKYKYKFISNDLKENRKRNSHPIPDISKGFHSLKGMIINVFSFKVKKEDSKIRGQVMARMVVQDPWGNTLDIVVFPDSWEQINKDVKLATAGKREIEVGLAINFTGVFQYDNENSTSFILDDILEIKEPPGLPADLKARKVKMPRGKKITSSDIETLDRETLAETLEDDLVDDGVSSIYEEEDDYVDPF